MNKLKQLFASGAVLTFMTNVAHADYGLNMPVGVTETSRQVYDLHMLILWVCVVIAVVVFGAMIYSMIYHRKSQGAVAAQFHESMTAELVWTVIPFVILVVMAIPATKVLIEMHDSTEADMSIKITGYQWKWRYEYLGEDIDFFSSLDAKSNAARQVGSDIDPATVDNYLLNVDRPLVIPVGKKVRFLLTSSDVIHAWWVPDFGWKKDAIPGFINEAWVIVDEPGVYRGQCAELCGRDHGFMPIVVEVKSEADYAIWLAEQKGTEAVVEKTASTKSVEPKELVQVVTEKVEAVTEKVQSVVEQAEQDVAGQVAKVTATPTESLSPNELSLKGEKVYLTNCAACHGAKGAGMPGVFPAITGSAVATGDKNNHINLVMNGKAGTAMTAFKTLLSDVELAAVITYQRNSLGNKVGDAVLPTEITALR